MFNRINKRTSNDILLKAYNYYLNGMEKVYKAGFEDSTYQDVVIWSAVVSLLREYEEQGEADTESLKEYFSDEDCQELVLSLYNVGRYLIWRDSTLKT